LVGPQVCIIYIHAAYHILALAMGFLDLLTSMTLNELEPPRRVFCEFFAIFGCSTHFKSELHQNGWR